MGSLTGKLNKIRDRKRLKQGSERKKRLRKFGTTPKFAVHQKAEDEQDKA